MKLAVGICVAVVLLVLAVWIFLILPRIRNAADRELIGVHYAHRGLHGENVPENSLAAFALARNAGYGIELDVRLSRDRRVMVFHDDTLKRMCGVDRRVEELTCAELQSLRLAGSDQTIPTLAQVLALIGGRVPLLIELKGTGRDESPLCKRVSKLLDDYAGAFAIESFNPMILSWFRNYRPRFARGILVTRTKPGEGRGRLVSFALTHMLFNVIARPDFIAVNYKRRSAPSVLLCTRVFQATGFAWTVRTPEVFHACCKAGMFCIFEKIQPRQTKQKRGIR